MPIKIKKITQLSQEEIALWQALWDKTPTAHFFNSPQYFLAFLSAFPMDYEVYFGYENDCLFAVVPLIEGKKYGIKTKMLPDRKKGFMDKSAILLEKNDRETFEKIVLEIGKENNLFLKDLSEDIFLSGEKIRQGFFQFETVCPRTFLCQDPFAKMKTKQRREIKRRMRKFGQDLKFELVENPTLDDFEKMKEIEKNSHKQREGIALFELEDAKKIYTSFFQNCKKFCVVSFLYYQGKLIAHLFGFVYGKTFLCTHMAFDEKYSNISPGKILVYDVKKELCEKDFKIFDFSKGDSQLKREFMCFFPSQYNLYFSKNKLVLGWWKMIVGMKEIVRKVKRIF